MKLRNYVLGKWMEGDGDGQPLYNAVTGELIATASTKGLDFEKIITLWWRSKRECIIKKMNFEERGKRC